MSIIKIIHFIAITVALLAGGVMYNRKYDEGVVREEQAAQEKVQKDKEAVMRKLVIEDITKGWGEEAKNGDMLAMHYTGTLDDGTKFDSSYDHGTAFSFTLGKGEVIQGWDMGILGMKVGGKRKLTIPPELGYGSR